MISFFLLAGEYSGFGAFCLICLFSDSTWVREVMVRDVKTRNLESSFGFEGEGGKSTRGKE